MTSSISDYQWASVGRYIGYLEQQLALTQVDAEKVYSFRISGSASRLYDYKKQLIATLEENNAKLCVYGHGHELGEDELNVIRGMYRANRDAVGVLRDHVKRLEGMKERGQYELGLKVDEAEDDDVPF